MSGRQTLRARCIDGCLESAYYDGMTIRERERLARQFQERPWLCSRHRQPDEVLGLENAQRTTVAIATRLIEGSTKLFWVQEGETTGSGLGYGPGFKAFADDFPEGTRLVVTAAIEEWSIELRSAEQQAEFDR